MAVGSLSSSSGAGITINIGGADAAANSTGSTAGGTDAIQADIQKLVEDLQKLSQSNATSEGGKSGKSDKSAKSHAPGQEKKAEKSQDDQSSKLMQLLSQILSIFAKMLGGGQEAGADTGTQDSGQQGVAAGEPNGSGTTINVNTK